MSECPSQPPHIHPALPGDVTLPLVPGLLSATALRARATGWLLLATALWGASFPLSKALYLAQSRLLPGVETWFLASFSSVVRFGLAGALLALGAGRTLRRLTRLEVSQGVGLGIFAAGGTLLQMDGLNYTSASTSAFLTSCFCVFIPVITACRRRRLPPARVAGSCALVAVGMAILAGVSPHTLRLGRGEWETVLASMFFAGQILWLERPSYARNRTAHATLVMFATLALLSTPVMLAHCHGRPGAEIFAAATGTPAIINILLLLSLGCTLVTFSLMNAWQRHLDATQAGLVYCAEPVWTSLSALCLPAWLAAHAGVSYENETLTLRLILGGALITVANIAVQFRPAAWPFASRTR